MTISNDDWEKLNAYADGEMSEKEIFATEQLLLSNSDLRLEYARLLELKSSLRRMCPGKDETAKAAPLSRQRRIRWLSGIAAAVAVISILSYFGLSWIPTHPTAQIAALELHNEFSSKTFILDKESPKLEISSVKYGRINVPDLTLSSLVLVDVLTTNISGQEIMAMHYRGQNGCRLTLVGIEQAAGEEKLEFTVSKTLLRQSWQHHGFHFVALANGMDEGRFRAISHYLIEDTKGSVEKLQRLQIAMHQAYKKSRPCV
jgi:anti-sigma factor RsiW